MGNITTNYHCTVCGGVANSKNRHVRCLGWQKLAEDAVNDVEESYCVEDLTDNKKVCAFCGECDGHHSDDCVVAKLRTRLAALKEATQ